MKFHVLTYLFIATTQRDTLVLSYCDLHSKTHAVGPPTTPHAAAEMCF